MQIRSVEEKDYAKILEIYKPFITDTCVTFETAVPDILKFSKKIKEYSSQYPFLVCETGGSVIGYAYACKHRQRDAYKYSADISIYITQGYHRKGIGKALYVELFERLKVQGIYTAYAGVALPNEQSVGLHNYFDFREVGVYRNVGYKHGRWIDVVWFEKPLLSYEQIIRQPADT